MSNDSKIAKSTAHALRDLIAVARKVGAPGPMDYELAVACDEAEALLRNGQPVYDVAVATATRPAMKDAWDLIRDDHELDRARRILSIHEIRTILKHAGAQHDALIAATRKLAFAARTSGGTAGRDDGLCAALDAVEALLPPMPSA
jgi:hypothetical protein